MNWKPPSGLGVDGKLAFVVAAEAAGWADERRTGVERYANAVDLAQQIRREWKAAGRPVTLTQPNGVCGVHPLLKALQDAEQAAARAERDVFAKGPGNVGPRSPDRAARASARAGAGNGGG